MKISLPYGKKMITADLPEDRVAGILQCKGYVPDKGEEELVKESMEFPIGSPKLSELARGKQKIVVIASDHTRPVPSKIIMPQILKELREGNPFGQITILIATGAHRATTNVELEEKFGRDIVKEERIVVHDCEEEENLVTIGTLPSGGGLRIHRLAAEADLLVSEGFIEPHFFAGYSGGRKSVLPGISSRTCIHYNHNSAFIDHPCARAGILEDNPIHTDMAYAAQKAKLAYIVNVVLDSKKRIIASFAGDHQKAYLAGVEFMHQLAFCAPIVSDVVITTNQGYPLDQNLYQMVKCMTTAEATCREKGVIIAVGACAAGIGGDSFYRSFQNAGSVSELLEDFRKTPPEETATDQWQSQILARILEHYHVILVSELEEAVVKTFHMIPAKTVAQAITFAETILDRSEYQITVIPDGLSVIIGAKAKR